MKKIISLISISIISAFAALNLSADNGRINILDLGAKNDGSEDISAIVNAHTEEGTIYLPAGLYKVSAPLKIKNPLIGDGYSRITSVKPSKTWLISDIKCDKEDVCGVIEIQKCPNVNVEELNIKCNSKEDAIRIEECAGVFGYITKVGICNVGGCGIRALGHGSRPIFIETVSIHGTTTRPCNSIGVIIEPHDCRINNTEVMSTRVGLIVRGGYAYGNNLHLWTGDMSRVDDGGEWWKGTRGIVLEGKGASFIGSQIYPDTCYYCFEHRNNNDGAFDINEILYYDDGSEKCCPDHNGAWHHIEEGSSGILRIRNGIVAVCGNDEKPYWMTQLYTPGQDIKGVSIRCNYALTADNIGKVCFSDELPDYTVKYDESGWCRIGDILMASASGCVRATLIHDSGATWEMTITKDETGKLSTEFKPCNKICKNYQFKTIEEKGDLKLFISSDKAFSLRFVTNSMNAYFRPVDHGSLREHATYKTRCHEVLAL